MSLMLTLGKFNLFIQQNRHLQNMGSLFIPSISTFRSDGPSDTSEITLAAFPQSGLPICAMDIL